ncbi:MAG: hypothetical protein HYW37_01775 [Candidatus Colwellbacteria bacterium]|nr:hypothetical protein [Candidatus Colwellbacteria bacterium]
MFWNSAKPKEREPEKEEGDNTLSRAVYNLEDGVLAYDNRFKITLFNKAAGKILGVSADEILGEIIGPELVKQPKFRLLTQVIFPSLAPVVVREGDGNAYPQIARMEFTNPDTKLRVLSDRILDPDGEATSFVKIIHDLTREEALIRAKSEFIAVAAHQLRTPLTAVNWIFENLNKSVALSVDEKEMVTNGLQASAQLLKVVNDLLDVAKIEDGRFGYDFEDIDLPDFIDSVLKNANPVAKEYGVTLYFDRGPEAVPVVRGDPVKLGIVLSNLLDNAIKYNTKNGSVTVGLEVLKDKPYVQISVKDTGIGVPPEDVPKLFTKFFRADNAVRIQTSGSGLGLYITKNIMARHGGTIWAESTLGRGTTFFFTLPTDFKLIPPRENLYQV